MILKLSSSAGGRTHTCSPTAMVPAKCVHSNNFNQSLGAAARCWSQRVTFDTSTFLWWFSSSHQIFSLKSFLPRNFPLCFDALALRALFSLWSLSKFSGLSNLFLRALRLLLSLLSLSVISGFSLLSCQCFDLENLFQDGMLLLLLFGFSRGSGSSSTNCQLYTSPPFSKWCASIIDFSAPERRLLKVSRPSLAPLRSKRTGSGRMMVPKMPLSGPNRMMAFTSVNVECAAAKADLTCSKIEHLARVAA